MGATGREGCAGEGKWPQTSETGGGSWHAKEGARGGEAAKAWQLEGGLELPWFLRRWEESGAAAPSECGIGSA